MDQKECTNGVGALGKLQMRSKRPITY